MYKHWSHAQVTLSRNENIFILSAPRTNAAQEQLTILITDSIFNTRFFLPSLRSPLLGQFSILRFHSYLMDTSADSHSTQYIQLSPENAVHFLISLLRSNNTKHFCIQNNPMLTLTYTNNRATISVTLLRATSFPGLLTHGTGMMLPGTASISLT